MKPATVENDITAYRIA